VFTDMAKFTELRQQDYNLFLTSKAADEAGNIVPERMLAVTEREIAAGRMTETDELHRLARAAIMTLQQERRSLLDRCTRWQP
jgi:hypothetical protein